MRSTFYRAGEFEIDTLVRELRFRGAPVELPGSAFDCLVHLIENRHRAVGRDELIAAVWGRADVSETLLGHTVVRLRRALGDSGNDQHSIRTMPRVGYRWVAVTTEPRVEQPTPMPSGEAALDSSVRPAEAVGASPLHQREPEAIAQPNRARIWLAALLLVVIVVVLVLSRDRSGAPTLEPPMSPPMATGLVLPAKVTAGHDWNWLRLGIMDLVAGRLQRGSISTLQSDTVLGLLKNAAGDSSALLSDVHLATLATLRVAPSVEFSGQTWLVRLDAIDGDRRLQVDARDVDALVAARKASDLLLAKLGHAPPVDESPISPALEQVQQQVKAATLAGQLDLARALVRDAPDAVRDSPELAWSSALIAASAGDYESARRDLDGLLDRVSGEQNPALRARALTMRAAMYLRRGKSALAGADFAQAISLVEALQEPLILAHAFTGRGLVAATDGRYNEAVADLGRARVISESANGTLSIAQIDLNLGLIARDRGQLGAAMPVLIQAAKRFEALASQEEWAVAMEAIADIQMSNLEYDDALATTDRFWPPEEHVGNVRLQWSLMLTRASVFAKTGRLDDAELLAGQVKAISSEPTDAALKARANTVLASIDRGRGDAAKAATTAAAALVPELEDTYRSVYRDAGLLYVGSLQATGQISAAARESRTLQAWLLSRPEDPSAVYAAFVEAEQARAEGKADVALQNHALAWEAAGRLGVPDLLVMCAGPYVDLLIEAGRLEDASAIAGRVAPWGERDVRVALVEVRLYKAMNETGPWQKAASRVVRLAGQRLTPTGLESSAGW